MNLQREHVGLAVILIAVGVVLLLANLGLFDLDVGDLIGTWWPSILIAFGLWKLLADRRAGVLTPGILIGLGVVLQVVTLGWAGWGAIWPAILIVIGVAVLFQGARTRRRVEVTSGDGEDLFAMFSGIERRITSSSYRGGKVTAIFGAVELDLRESQLAEGASMNATALFGGVELKVPEEWNVEIHGSPLFGAIEDAKGKRSTGEQHPGPTLQIHASVTFGALEIKR